jgi:NAD(P)-dependent dehydrogenase (short-subunit alcohol dehydrogenase family)
VPRGRRSHDRAVRRVDRLVNSAALTTRSTLLETTPEFFDEQIAVNVRGPFFLMQAVIGHLVERAAAGSVVNISSMNAHGGQPHLAAYSMSKAGSRV